LYLTASGRRKIDGLLPNHDQFVLKVLRGISDTDAASLRKVLEKPGADGGRMG